MSPSHDPREAERVWISLIVRFAFGFLFIFAAIQFFWSGLGDAAQALSDPFASTWLGDLLGFLPLQKPLIYYFVYAMPFIFLALGFLLLTGIFIRAALRLSAIFLVMLGLGKYVTGDTATTAYDFTYALLICFALYLIAEDRAVRQVPEEVEKPETSDVPRGLAG